MNHATVLHAINNVFPVIEREEPLLYEIYNKLKKEDDVKYLKENYYALRNEYEKLLKLKTYDEHEELVIL